MAPIEGLFKSSIEISVIFYTVPGIDQNSFRYLGKPTMLVLIMFFTIQLGHWRELCHFVVSTVTTTVRMM